MLVQSFSGIRGVYGKDLTDDIARRYAYVFNSFLHKKNKTYEKGFQIDLLIDRKDDVMNMCEMKFYADEFSISADYAKILRTKKQGLTTVTRTKKTIYTTFITTYGVLDNPNKSDLVDHDFTIDIFFD